MTARRHIHIDLDLPELTPAQADFLSNFLDDLAADLWDAYEQELLAVEEQRSRQIGSHDDWSDADCDDLVASPPVSDDPNPDF